MKCKTFTSKVYDIQICPNTETQLPDIEKTDLTVQKMKTQLAKLYSLMYEEV